MTNSQTGQNIQWWLKLIIGPVLFLILVLGFDLSPGNPKVTIMAGITLWMAAWWLTEVVDLAVSSLLPLIILPVCGIMDAKMVAQQYNDQVIFLFVGGFIISFAIQKWDLHKRIALKVLSLIGSSPQLVLFGVMATTYFISMWMSNTATVMMLLSAVLAINTHIEQEASHFHQKRFSAALLLGLAYAASIGGMATLVGTPTNMIFYGYYKSHLPADTSLNFLSWFQIGFPVSLALMLFTFALLRFFYIKNEVKVHFDKSFFKTGYKHLGRLSYEEKWVAIIFACTAILWFTRDDLKIGSFEMHGWSNIFIEKAFIQDSTVAVFMALLLFVIPSKQNKGEQLLMWEDAKKLPYDIILLFGSGFALAKGFDVSRLSEWMAGHLNFLKGAPIAVIILAVCVVVCIISEFASNVASIQLVLPVLLAVSKSIDVNPLLLMLPATLAASLGYMLPVATAANTIVFGTKMVPLKSMLRSGFWVDLAGIVLICLGGLFLVQMLLDA